MKNTSQLTLAHLTSDENTQSSAFPEMPEEIEIVSAKAVPRSHEAEPDLFARHEGIPAHDQMLLESATILLVGGGGLNSWVGVGLARSGARVMTAVDGDRVDRTNLSRQFFTAADLGLPKGNGLAVNLAGQAVGGGTFTGIGLHFEEAVAKYPIPADLIIAGVDNNECRRQVVREARRRNIPAVFSMLSGDGMRCQVFLQNASRLEPCLWCALPNLDPDRIMPCASAIISSCLMTAGFTIFFAHRALMGWGALKPFNWREADLSGIAPDRIGTVKRSPSCPICAEFD